MSPQITNIVGRICAFTWLEYNNYGQELTVTRRFGNEDVSDCLTLASILNKLAQRHPNTSAYKVQHSDFVILNIMEINQ